MKDVTCPYCGTDQDINHDDGYGYDEDGDYEQECVSCDKTFKFTTMVSFSYNVYCDGEHDMEQNPAPYSDLWDCSRCDYYELRR